MRKRLSKADRLVDPLQESNLPASLLAFFRPPADGSKETSENGPRFSLEYSLGQDLTDELLEQLVDLFEQNMGEFYRNSSFGLDLNEKADEFRHRRARFLLVYSSKKDDVMKELAAFVHFRFDYDDDENPSRVVLYVFEIQLDTACRRQGLGRKLMKIIEYIAVAAGLDRILLTVFKKNTAAMDFYTRSLCYTIDESSPSKFGETTDYEILTKQVP